MKVSPPNIKEFSTDLNIRANFVLANRTSWLIGGPADFFGEPHTIFQLEKMFAEARVQNIPVTILGGGTNVLISDKGIKGLVICTSKLSGLEIVEDKTSLKFWALTGTPKSELLKLFLKHKLAPAKMLAGLPGQVGGGVVMNAGVSESLTPREFSEITEAVEVLRPDGTLEIIHSKNLKWDYRHCSNWQPGVITRALVVWPMQSETELLSEVKKLNQSRLAKQPLDLPSCGSVFRNPNPRKAGQLIEEAGLKGYRVGGAQISEKHANFIVNLGGATAQDVSTIISHCKSVVKSKFKVELRSEVEFLGDF